MPAWDRWKAENDINHLEAGTFRLLGLLYRNLVRVGVDPADPLLPRLRGIYRNFWTKNQIVLGRKGTVLKALAAEGIPCMLLKGAGLTLTVYRDHGVRPMDDFDLLVPLSRVGQAMDILEGLGWQSQVHAPRELPASIHACSFRDAAEATIDLHWRLCHLPAGRDFDRTLWEGRQLLELHGEPAGVPCATDQFLHTCAHVLSTRLSRRCAGLPMLISSCNRRGARLTGGGWRSMHPRWARFRGCRALWTICRSIWR
ncbi:nucleotidyltransferase family protein [Verrucomicrobium spinosum]|uniref:nucleotidyltransferase family protein n=1 Tax=Verrucomicrobium spinosum TaxID=2736 RepID=UPI0009464FA0|nr:nucleotidyltransferase family protein [Verrucomicrobium spinosum]